MCKLGSKPPGRQGICFVGSPPHVIASCQGSAMRGYPSNRVLVDDYLAGQEDSALIQALVAWGLSRTRLVASMEALQHEVIWFGAGPTFQPP